MNTKRILSLATALSGQQMNSEGTENVVVTFAQATQLLPIF